MPLRVTLTIVPFGNEKNKYDIGTLDISNLGRGDHLGRYQYSAKLYSDGGTLLKETTTDRELTHNRQEGAWVLVNKALEALDIAS
jgi:hypothetical protein